MIRYLLPITCGVLACSHAAANFAPLHCGGVEPFWSLDIEQDSATFAQPDQASVEFEVSERLSAAGRMSPEAILLSAPQSEATAIVTRRACTDTMSDHIYEVVIDFLMTSMDEPVLYSGCCRTVPQ